MKKIFYLCRKYLICHKFSLTIYIFLCVFSGIISMLSPYILGNFIDLLVSAQNYDFLLAYCLIFATLSIGQIILGYISNMMYVRLQVNMGYELNRDTIKHIQSVSLSYIKDKDKAYLNQRINNDSNAVIIFCISTLQNIIINVLMIIFPFVLLLSLNTSLTIVMAILIVIYFLSYRAFKNIIFRVSYKFKEMQSLFFGKLYEQIFNINFIKIHALGNDFANRLENIFKKLESSVLNYQKVSYFFSGLDNIITTASKIILFAYGGIEVVRGNLSIGYFTVISSYFGMMMNSVRYFFNLGKNIQDNIVCYNRLIDIQNVTKETNGNRELSQLKKIDLNKIMFYYEEKKVIDNFTATFQSGNIYTIVGSNGTGKSTLIYILLGLYIDEYKGEVLYNNIPIQQIDMLLTRSKLMGITEQEPVLLNDTILYNLLLNEDDELDNNQLASLASMLGLDSFLNSLPNGIDTIINENAFNLSGGEKQKLSLLRVLLKNPDVIVLDEPSSAMDVESRIRLKKYLHSIKKDKIIIIVTHDEGFLDISDVNIILDK